MKKHKLKKTWLIVLGVVLGISLIAQIPTSIILSQQKYPNQQNQINQENHKKPNDQSIDTNKSANDKENQLNTNNQDPSNNPLNQNNQPNVNDNDLSNNENKPNHESPTPKQSFFKRSETMIKRNALRWEKYKTMNELSSLIIYNTKLKNYYLSKLNDFDYLSDDEIDFLIKQLKKLNPKIFLYSSTNNDFFNKIEESNKPNEIINILIDDSFEPTIKFEVVDDLITSIDNKNEINDLYEKYLSNLINDTSFNGLDVIKNRSRISLDELNNDIDNLSFNKVYLKIKNQLTGLKKNATEFSIKLVDFFERMINNHENDQNNDYLQPISDELDTLFNQRDLNRFFIETKVFENDIKNPPSVSWKLMNYLKRLNKSNTTSNFVNDYNFQRYTKYKEVLEKFSQLDNVNSIQELRQTLTSSQKFNENQFYDLIKFKSTNNDPFGMFTYNQKEIDQYNHFYRFLKEYVYLKTINTTNDDFRNEIGFKELFDDLEKVVNLEIENPFVLVRRYIDYGYDKVFIDSNETKQTFLDLVKVISLIYYNFKNNIYSENEQIIKDYFNNLDWNNFKNDLKKHQDFIKSMTQNLKTNRDNVMRYQNITRGIYRTRLQVTGPNPNDHYIKLDDSLEILSEEYINQIVGKKQLSSPQENINSELIAIFDNALNQSDQEILMRINESDITLTNQELKDWYFRYTSFVMNSINDFKTKHPNYDFSTSFVSQNLYEPQIPNNYKLDFALTNEDIKYILDEDYNELYDTDPYEKRAMYGSFQDYFYKKPRFKGLVLSNIMGLEERLNTLSEKSLDGLWTIEERQLYLQKYHNVIKNVWVQRNHDIESQMRHWNKNLISITKEQKDIIKDFYNYYLELSFKYQFALDKPKTKLFTHDRPSYYGREYKYIISGIWDKFVLLDKQIPNVSNIFKLDINNYQLTKQTSRLPYQLLFYNLVNLIDPEFKNFINETVTKENTVSTTYLTSPRGSILLERYPTLATEFQNRYKEISDQVKNQEIKVIRALVLFEEMWNDLLERQEIKQYLNTLEKYGQKGTLIDYIVNFPSTSTMQEPFSNMISYLKDESKREQDRYYYEYIKHLVENKQEFVVNGTNQRLWIQPVPRENLTRDMIQFDTLPKLSQDWLFKLVFTFAKPVFNFYTKDPTSLVFPPIWFLEIDNNEIEELFKDWDTHFDIVKPWLYRSGFDTMPRNFAQDFNELFEGIDKDEPILSISDNIYHTYKSFVAIKNNQDPELPPSFKKSSN